VRVLQPKLVAFVVVMACALMPASAAGIGESAKTFRISVTSDEGQALRSSSEALISGDGRYVVFESGAALDGGGRFDNVFLRDRSRGITRLISVAGAGRQLNNVALVSAVSKTGRYILFDTAATNIGPGDGDTHTYLRDRRRGSTTLVRPGAPSNAERGVEVSAAGRFVTFAFDRGGTTTLLLNDRRAGTVRVVGRSKTVLTGGRISHRAQQVLFARGAKLFVWNRIGGRRQSVPLPAAADLVEAVDISDDGRFVLFDLFRFDTLGNVFSDAYVRDRQAGVTTRVSVGPPEFSTRVIANSVSDDGRYVAFESSSSAFVPGDSNGQNDMFVRDMTAGETLRVSMAADGSQLSSFSAFGRGPALSADGRVVAFSTPAAAVADDTNRVFDVFVRWPLH
jgi:Tol biopolymer transport system component